MRVSPWEGIRSALPRRVFAVAAVAVVLLVAVAGPAAAASTSAPEGALGNKTAASYMLTDPQPGWAAVPASRAMLDAVETAASQTETLTDANAAIGNWSSPSGDGTLGIIIITWSPLSSSSIAPGILAGDLCGTSIPLTPVPGVSGGGSITCSVGLGNNQTTLITLVIGTKGPTWYLVYTTGLAPLTTSQVSAIAVEQQNALPNVILRDVLIGVLGLVILVVVFLLVRMLVRHQRSRKRPPAEQTASSGRDVGAPPASDAFFLSGGSGFAGGAAPTAQRLDVLPEPPPGSAGDGAAPSGIRPPTFAGGLPTLFGTPPPGGPPSAPRPPGAPSRAAAPVAAPPAGAVATQQQTVSGAVGWHAVDGDPLAQTYWDGTAWTKLIRWDGTAWVESAR